MTLHSNKLILPEHTANLSRERETKRTKKRRSQKSGRFSARGVQRGGVVAYRGGRAVEVR